MQGTPLIEMTLEDFSHPITIATSTQFLTAKAVAPHMIKQGSGVIMMITATPARLGIPLVGGFSVACAALESLSRSLAAEALGPKGVRAIRSRSAGSPESIAEVMDVHAAGHRVTRDEFIASLKDMTLLKRLPSFGLRGPRGGPDGVRLCRFNDRDGRQHELRPNCRLDMQCSLDR